MIGLGLATLTSVALLVIPVVSEDSAGSNGDFGTTQRTLIEANGLPGILAVAAPVVLAGCAVLVAGRSRPALVAITALLVVGSLVAAASIGLLYLPAGIALITAAAVGPPPQTSPPQP